MTTLVEKDSSAPTLFMVVILILLLVGGGLAFAYMNGALGDKTTVIENNRTVEERTVVVPAGTPTIAPVREPGLEKPEPRPAH
jgi:hypothetical protein